MDHAAFAADWYLRAMMGIPPTRTVLFDAVVMSREENPVAVALMIDNPDGTQVLYDKVLAALALSRPAGGTLHLAGPSPNGGWRVIEVFESAEAASRFITERLGPAFKAAGATGPPPEPQLWPVHNCMT